MESLYRKYRPQTFEDVVGQQHVVSTLEHAIVEGRTSHAYLFCGPRGTGKTTMARLLAKALLCERGAGQLPDGTCEQCQLIAAGEHPDVYELDAASRTGVDNVREEIINNVSFAPVGGRHKVYIIDEVHMLTTAAFNALLKTLEEPPAHVTFVLCTTDPQKMPATILSRVQRFDFRSISNAELQQRLAYVCEQENFSYEPAALELVARHARGGMRDALSSLEQLSVFGAGSVTFELASGLLGEVSSATLAGITKALAARDVVQLFSEVATLVDEGQDLLQFTREWAAHLRDVYVIAAVGPRADIVYSSQEELGELSEEAAAFGSADRISRILGILSETMGEMRTARDPRLTLELAFTRCARPESDLTLESLAERIAVLEARACDGAALPVAKPAAEASRPVAVPKPKPRPVAAPKPEPASAAVSHPTAPALHPLTPQTAPVQSQQSASSAYTAHTAASAAAMTSSGDWNQVIAQLQQAAPSSAALLRNSSVKSDDGSTLVVALHDASSFAAKMLSRPEVAKTVNEAVAVQFGRRQVVYETAASVSSATSAVSAMDAPASRPVSSPSAPQPQSQAAPMPTPAAVVSPLPQSAPAQPAAATAQKAPVQAEAPAPASTIASPPTPNPTPTSAAVPVTHPASTVAPQPSPAKPLDTSQPDFDPSDAASVMNMLVGIFGDGVKDRSDQN
ncbi:DNA polymerase III, subunit gamma and tau [Coriobacteriaceae bacterium BV3Ac1]|uniref:DNA polymerase III subunit gamma/tau n=1 Tax=Olegusella massiliensis TaxID=1776381 RepID=UPI0003AE571F|nr:DNA polymerase III subunit gamma/tau [Olegusella massiliensis]ERL13334.1 DNA polymerase III, subunit gamma and tau [Coriobacteriaceae bacterium BV3Ac1]